MKKTLCVILFSAVLFACGSTDDTVHDEGLSVSKIMGDPAESNFAKALKKREFTFPADHGPHPDYRTEWWYFTGNLTGDDGNEFGYQFTIFRTGLTREEPQRASAWSSNQIYMAHVALTDISGDRFYYSERFSRGGNGLSGARINPLRVWQEDWQILQQSHESHYDIPILRIAAEDDKFTIDLSVQALKPVVLQGDEGLSQKGSGEGNASYYYSYTRLQTKGMVRVENRTYEVSGLSWLDREWSTSALSGDQAGWDWFALQLDDGSEIMYYQMRTKDGRADRYSKGTVVEQDGGYSKIGKDDVNLEVLGTWQSPAGTVYPSGWRLQIPDRYIDLEIVPVIEDQLLDVTVRYWEGSVRISGKNGDASVAGRGYVELTGY